MTSRDTDATGRAACPHKWEPVEIDHSTAGSVDRSWIRCRLCGTLVKGVEAVLKEAERG